MAASCQNRRGGARGVHRERIRTDVDTRLRTPDSSSDQIPRAHALFHEPISRPDGLDPARTPAGSSRPIRVRPALRLPWARILGAFLLLAAFGAPEARSEGGTRGSNGLVPSLSFGPVRAGDTVRVTVGNIPPTSSGRRVYVAFSNRYGGIDVSSMLGSGAVLVPRVSFDPSQEPVIEPAFSVDGASPSRVLELEVSPRLVGRSFWVQALVEDPTAPGGGGWSLSEGTSIVIGERGDPVVEQIVISPDSASPWAGTVQTMRVELKDASGVMVPVRSIDEIQLELLQGTGTISYPHVEGSRFVFLYDVGTRVERAVLKATERRTGSGLHVTSQLDVSPRPPDGQLPLVAQPTVIPADGSSTTQIVGGPLQDEFGNTVSDGSRVTVSASLGTLLGQDLSRSTPGFQVETRNGLFTLNLRSSTEAGSSLVRADSLLGSASGSVTVGFSDPSPTVASVFLAPDTVEVEVGQTAVLTAELRDGSGQMVPASSVAEVSFSRTSGSGSLSGARLVSGRILVDYRAANTVESSTVRATEQVSGNRRSDTSRVASRPGLPAGSISMTSSDASLPADGQSTASVQAGPVTDRFGNRVPNGTLITVSASLGDVTGGDFSGAHPGIQRTTNNGFVSFSLRSPESPGTSVLRATSVQGSATGSTNVEFTPVEPDVATVALSPPFGEVVVGRDLVMTAEMLDAEGHLVPATSVSDINFAVSPGQGTFAAKQIVSGRVRTTFTADQQAENVRIVAAETLTGDVNADHTWLTIKPDAPSGTVGLTSSPDTLPGDGQSRAIVSSSVIRDRFGNTVASDELFTVSASRGAIVSQDLEVGIAGIQVAAQDGRISFEMRAPVGAGDSDLQVRSVGGTASGSLRLSVTAVSGPADFEVLQAGTLPEPRGNMGVAYDRSQGVAYVFGGIGTTLPVDILSIDFSQPFGSQLRTLPDTLPKSRYAAPAVWDSLRGKAYVFGGSENPVFNHYDVLAFDPSAPEGSRVSSVSGASLPYPVNYSSAVWDDRGHAAYIFDGGRGELRVLKFDPASSSIVELGDRLPGSWTRSAAVWDEVGKVAYIFGGLDRFRIRDEIVRFDPSAPNGSRLTVISDRIPNGRVNATATWDFHRNVAYLMGGSNQAGDHARILEFDPSRPSGRRITDRGTVVSIVTGSGSFYDSGTQRAFIVGGQQESSGFSDSILGFDPGSLRSNIVNKLTQPNALSTAVWDPTTGRTYIFGGRQRSGFHDLVYSIDPDVRAGTQMELTSDRLPSARYALASVWADSEGAAYLFGGKTSLSSGTDQILRFDPRAGGSRVTLLGSDRLPRPIFNSAAVWDPQARVAYLFDSSTSSSPVKVVRFNPAAPAGTKVSELSDTLPGRLSVSAVWDPNQGVAYLFGGADRRGTLTEIIRFDPDRPAGSRFEVLPDHFQGGRSATAAAWDSFRGVAYIFGGGAEIAVFDPTKPAGQRLSPVGSMAHSISFPSAVYDAMRRRAFCIGGLNPDGEYETNVQALVEQP